MNINEEILKLASEYEQYVVDCRRKVHCFAELCTRETKTKAFILEEIKKLGLPYEEVPTTSVIAKLDTGRPGKCIVLRADIDALPLAESPTNLVGPRVCVSEQPNTCHACGHDAHTAMLLGAMQVLCRMKDSLSGTILFCFEEGEEMNTGVQACLKALEKYPVDYCWALHLYAELEEGKICVDAGPRMAGAKRVDLKFIGKRGHGSRPDLAANPVFCAANFLNNLCVAFSQQIAASKTVTMGITMVHSGEVNNLIDETADIKGSFRFFDIDEGEKAVQIMRNTAEHTAAIHKCRVEYAPDSSYGNPPVVNNEETAAVASRVLNEILPAGAVASCPPWFASESFPWYLLRYKGVFAFLGIKNEAAGYGAPHHNEKFDFNEAIMKTGVISTARFAAELLINP